LALGFNTTVHALAQADSSFKPGRTLVKQLALILLNAAPHVLWGKARTAGLQPTADFAAWVEWVHTRKPEVTFWLHSRGFQGRAAEELAQRQPEATLYFALEAVEAQIMHDVLSSLPPTTPSVLYLYDGLWVHRAVPPEHLQQHFATAAQTAGFPLLQLQQSPLWQDKAALEVHHHLILPRYLTAVAFPFRKSRHGALPQLFSKQSIQRVSELWDPPLPSWPELLDSFVR
jgi:hypothetical protein